jgi:hypothetical protein
MRVNRKKKKYSFLPCTYVSFVIGRWANANVRYIRRKKERKKERKREREKVKYKIKLETLKERQVRD